MTYDFSQVFCVSINYEFKGLSISQSITVHDLVIVVLYCKMDTPITYKGTYIRSSSRLCLTIIRPFNEYQHKLFYSFLTVYCDYYYYQDIVRFIKVLLMFIIRVVLLMFIIRVKEVTNTQRIEKLHLPPPSNVTQHFWVVTETVTSGEQLKLFNFTKT